MGSLADLASMMGLTSVDVAGSIHRSRKPSDRSDNSSSSSVHVTLTATGDTSVCVTLDTREIEEEVLAPSEKGKVAGV